jgi:hypothetical protein
MLPVPAAENNPGGTMAMTCIVVTLTIPRLCPLGGAVVPFQVTIGT